MAITEKDFKYFMRGKNLTYSDDFYTLKGNKVYPANSFSYNIYNALDNAIDFKTSNYSNVFINNLSTTETWLQAEYPNKEIFFNYNIKKIVVSDIMCIRENNNNFLLFPYTQTQKTNDLIYCSGSYEKDSEQTTFLIEFVSNIYCTISHDFCGTKFYLNPENQNDGTNTNYFRFDADEHLIQYEIIEEDDTSITLRFYSDLTLKTYIGLSKSNVLKPTTSTKNLFKIKKPNGYDLTPLLNDSWITYKKQNITGEINTSSSYFDLENQFLFHHEYNNDNGINFFPLKNKLAYGGNTIIGHTHTTEKEKDIDFRKYNNILIDSSREKGTQNISLSFNFYDQEFPANDGEDVEFYPCNLYYKGKNTMSISDTMFIKNGAFGSDVPWFADKIKKVGQIFKQEYGTYLCTWLKYDEETGCYSWQDRYYNPSRISKMQASSSTIHDYIYDVPSEMTIDDDKKYIYSRLSSEMVCEMMGKADCFLNECLNENNKKVNLFDDIQFDNKTYRKIDCSKEDNITSFNFNTDLFIDPNKRMGVQMFGTSLNQGFNITNRTDISPYHYYADDEKIYLLNNKYETCNSVDIKEMFGDYILKFVIGEIFSDFIIISQTHLFVLSYDLKVRYKISLSGNNNEPSILGLFDNGGDDYVFNDDNNVIGYPFTDTYTTFSFGDFSVASGNIICTNDRLSRKSLYSSNYIGSQTVERPIYISFADFGYIDFKTEKIIHNELSEILTTKNSKLVDGILYIPYRSGVIEIMFKENENFTQEERKLYPAKVIYNNSIYSNFIKPVEDTQDLSSSVFIDENNCVYVFDYDYITMTQDKDTVYGQYEDDNTIYAETLSDIRTSGDNYISSPVKIYSSSYSIDKFRTNENGYTAMVVNFSSKTTDTNTTFRIFDETRECVLEQKINGYDSIVSLDSYNYIDEDNTEKSVFVLLMKTYASVMKLTYDCNTGKLVRNYIQGINTDPCLYFEETTNNDALLRSSYTNCLHFNLYLPSQYIAKQKYTITLPIEKYERGWYNINVDVNLPKGRMSVKVNDILYEQKCFTPYSAIQNGIFNHIFYLGTIGLEYGYRVNDILKNATTSDPYVFKNTEMQNTYFSTRSLTPSEYQAMRLYKKNINPIVLTIPIKPRYAVDEIVRFFRYSGGGHISNDIKLTIDGSNVKNPRDKEKLREEIKAELEGKIDALVNIKDIEIL